MAGLSGGKEIIVRKVRIPSFMSKRALWLALGAGVAAAVAGLAFGQEGNITPESIEIDASANLVDNNNGGLNNGTVDWILDDEDNTGTDCLVGGIAECNEADVTAHPQGVGRWNGVRIVDFAASADNDIFLGGSKFDDPASWVVGAGNIGGSKFDGSQAYLANNASHLFFGMERLGFNGTTAWDFEFNAKPPLSAYVPDRSVGDVLFVYETSGSGGSGSVTPFIYTWDGGQFVAINPIPAGIHATINTAAVAAGPWGYRDTKGAWQLGSLPKFTFAEVGLPIGEGGIELPVDPANCSQSAWVSIRTRASNEFTSDMKDAFPIFEYQFSGLSVSAMKTDEDGDTFEVTVTGSASGGSPSLQWEIHRVDNDTWVPITGATGSALTFPSGAFDWVAPYRTATAITKDAPLHVQGDCYIGQIYAVDVRLSASQSVGGESCTLTSNAVTVKKLVAVDP